MAGRTNLVAGSPFQSLLSPSCYFLSAQRLCDDVKIVAKIRWGLEEVSLYGHTDALQTRGGEGANSHLHTATKKDTEYRSLSTLGSRAILGSATTASIRVGFTFSASDLT